MPHLLYCTAQERNIMKICIPVENNEGIESVLYDHFGSAPHFLIYDTETGNHAAVSNSNQHHTHGMCQPIEALSGSKFDVIVCRGMGARAVQKLNMSGIQVYKTEREKVKDIIEHYENESRNPLTPDGACQDHSCH